MIRVLHNSSCSKSRAVLEYLDEHNVPFEIIDIIENPLSEAELRTLLKKLGVPVSEIIRKQEKFFTENFADKNLSDNELIKVLAENPSLIQRPILVKKGTAIIGRPVENISDFIS